MDEPSLLDILREVAALREQVTQQQQELSELKNRPTATEPDEVTTTSRRRMLRRLAGGMVAGLAIGGVALAGGVQEAQARTIVNPAGVNKQIGTIVVPPGKPIPTGAPLNNTYLYGLVGTDGSSALLKDVLPQINVGLVGFSASGAGVYGGTSNSAGYGMYGYNSSDSGTGVFGYTTGIQSKAVSGSASGLGSSGVYGYATELSSSGVSGYAIGDGSNGVSGYASGQNSSGVYGAAPAIGYAGYFNGAVQISGTLSKSSGSFKIDHPLDPANQYLYHSFVESPDMLNIYNGMVTLDTQGTAIVKLPSWFEALNADFRYGLTPLGQPSPDLYIAEEVKNGHFKIGGGKSGQRVSWQLTGIRQDEWAKAHRIPVEEIKPAHERGLYLHPELFGQGEENSVDYNHHKPH